MIGPKIAELRRAQGLSQIALGRAMGASANSYISKIEAPDSNPKYDTILLVANVLGVHPGELFNPVKEKAPKRGRPRIR